MFFIFIMLVFTAYTYLNLDSYWYLNLFIVLILIYRLYLSKFHEYNIELLKIDYFESILGDYYNNVKDVSHYDLSKEFNSNIIIENIKIYTLGINNYWRFLLVLQTSDGEFKFRFFWKDLDEVQNYIAENLTKLNVKNDVPIEIINLNEDSKFTQLYSDVKNKESKFNKIQNKKLLCVISSILVFLLYLILSNIVVFQLGVLLFIFFLIGIKLVFYPTRLE